jgi:hypothetical protein
VTDNSSTTQAISNDYYVSEEPRDPGSNALKAVLIALVLVVAAIGAYVYFGEKPPVATGELIHVIAIPIHQQSDLPAAAGMPGQTDSFDQVLVMAKVRLHNQAKIPLFLHEMYASLGLPDEEDERRSIAANKTDFGRAFVAYPQLLPLKGEPILRDITIEPGQTVEGMMLFPFPITGAQYDKKKSLDINVIFMHQKTLTMHVPQ